MVMTKIHGRTAQHLLRWTACLALAPMLATAAPVVGWVQQIAAVGDGLGLPSTASGYVAWTQATAPSSTGEPQAGVYRRDVSGRVVRLVDPGMEGLRHLGRSASVDAEGNVSFLAVGSSAEPGLYEWRSGQVRALADPLPGSPSGGAPDFRGFGEPVRDGGLTGWSARMDTGAGSDLPVLLTSDGRDPAVAVSAGDRTPTTLSDFARFGYSGHFDQFGALAVVDWNERRSTYGPDLAFLGHSSFSNGASTVNSSAIFVYDGFQNLNVAAERYMPLPGGVAGERFNLLQFSPALDDGTVAFTATGDRGTTGVYRSDLRGVPERVVDSTMTAPGGLGRFTDFSGWVSLGGGAVVFGAHTDVGGWGVFRAADGELDTVFTGDDFARLFPGDVWTNGLELGVQAASGHQVSWLVRGVDPVTGAFDAIVVATAVVPEPTGLGLALLALLIVTRSRSRRRTALRG